MLQTLRSGRRLFPAVATTMACALGSSCGHGQPKPTTRPTAATATAGAATGARPALIPWPASAIFPGGAPIAITKTTTIEITPGNPDLQRIARDLAELLRPSLETSLPVREGAPASPSAPASGVIRLEVVMPTGATAAGGEASGGTTTGEAKPGVTPTTGTATSGNANHGAAPSGTPSGGAATGAGAASAVASDEGYELTIASGGGIRISGRTAAGVFYGVQTLRQLLPASVELRGARPRAVSVPAAHIVDQPRFGWRGAMLDVARHFFSTGDVKHYIDLMAMYKLNHLHLHLSDDQGWRIEIASWPNLTKHGATTAVGGGAGGFYTKQDYADLIAYARERFITIVPEIDMPSHINAALASYPELNCNGTAPALYTGIEVGFSAFCVDKDLTYKFIDDVMRELAEMTPGPFLHIGGDEVKTLTPAQYRQFIERVQGIVQAHGKTVIGWDEVTRSTLLPTTIVQYWRPDASIKPAPGTKLILSPANKIYLDMKYDAATVLGLNWAGNVDVPVAYEWNPATLLPGVAESSILGIEAPIWSETVTRMSDVEFLAFPRFAGVAEVAWSPQEARNWSEFRGRLAAQAPRWSALGINAYWTPKVDWQR